MKKLSLRTSAFSSKFLSAILLVIGGSVHAENAYWKGTGGTGQNESRWSVNTNWTPETVPTSSTDVIFDNDANGSISSRSIVRIQLFADQTANSLNFSLSSAQTGMFQLEADITSGEVIGFYNLTLTTGIVTRNADTANVAVNVGATENNTRRRYMVLQTGASGFAFTNNDNNDLLFESVISGANKTATISATSAGKVAYTGIYANTYSGLTTVDAGTLVLQKLDGVNAIAGNIQVNTSGTLSIAVSNQIVDSSALVVNGGVVDLQANNETVGSITLLGGSIVGSGTLTGSSYTVQSGSISAVLSGSAGLTKTGSGTTTLSANNQYTGTTTISAGTLLLSTSGTNNIASSSVIDFTASGSGTLNVSGVSGGFMVVFGQTLKGAGTVIGDTTIAGNLAPGNSSGLMTFTDGLTLSGVATMEITSATTRGGTYDALDVGGALIYGGVLTFDLTGAGTNSFANGTVFDLFSPGSVGSGDLSSINILGASSPYFGLTFTKEGTGATGIWTSSTTSGGQSLVFSQITGDLTVVPEPATLGQLVAGLILLIGLRLRNRKASCV